MYKTCFTLWWTLTACTAAPLLSLNPVDGVIQGAAGEVAGWGFALSNPNDYLVVTSATFLTATPIGAFMDLISSQFVVVGPDELLVWTQAFSRTTGQGVGSYLIDAFAVPGSSAVGLIQVTYDLYSVSPNDGTFDPGIHLLESGGLLSADAAVVVRSEVTTVIPEPATVWLSLFAAALVRCGERRFSGKGTTGRSCG